MRATRNLVKAEIMTDTSLDVIIANAEGTASVPFVRIGSRGGADLQTEALLLAEQELLSIYAVLSHIAYNHDVNQEALLTMIEVEFSVDHVREIPHHRFHEVMEFLIDLRMDEVRSRR